MISICPLCHRPFTKFGLIGFYQPVYGGNPVPYKLCKACSLKIAEANYVDLANLLYQVERFFEKGVGHAKA